MNVRLCPEPGNSPATMRKSTLRADRNFLQRSKKVALFDDLVRGGEQRRGYFEAEPLRGLQIYD